VVEAVWENWGHSHTHWPSFMSVSNATLRGSKCTLPTQLSSNATATLTCCSLVGRTLCACGPMCSGSKNFTQFCKTQTPDTLPPTHRWRNIYFSFDGIQTNFYVYHTVVLIVTKNEVNAITHNLRIFYSLLWQHVSTQFSHLQAIKMTQQKYCLQ
jgi:hypothetical protein